MPALYYPEKYIYNKKPYYRLFRVLDDRFQTHLQVYNFQQMIWCTTGYRYARPIRYDNLQGFLTRNDTRAKNAIPENALRFALRYTIFGNGSSIAVTVPNIRREQRVAIHLNVRRSRLGVKVKDFGITCPYSTWASFDSYQKAFDHIVKRIPKANIYHQKGQQVIRVH